MRRQRKRPMHYDVMCLHDGTVIAGHPDRKPTPKIIKRDKIIIDDDGAYNRWTYSGKELSDVLNENRFRFQNIISNRLNTRRAIREIVMPELAQLKEDIKGIRNQLNEIQESLDNQSNR